MKKKNKSRKFFVSDKAKVWLGVIIFFGLDLYIACLYINYVVEMSEDAIFNEKIIIGIKAFQDAMLVLLSILCTSFTSALLIEVKGYNRLHQKIIGDEVLMATDYYDNMDVKCKKLVNDYLDKILYFNGKKPLVEMDSSIKKKISQFQEMQYFYSSYSAIINCKIEGDKIIKNISKTLNICSFDDKCTLKHLELANNVHVNDHNNYGIIENSFQLKIDGKISNAYKYETCEPEDSIEKKSGYNEKTIYRLSSTLSLSSCQARTIEVAYDTCSPKTDVFSGIRLPVASKKTTFQFYLSSDNNEHNKYKLVSCGFGFADTASKTHNNIKAPYSVNLTFDEWIFPKDGWVVVIQEKN